MTFLHVYHHASMCVLWWMVCKWIPGKAEKSKGKRRGGTSESKKGAREGKDISVNFISSFVFVVLLKVCLIILSSCTAVSFFLTCSV